MWKNNSTNNDEKFFTCSICQKAFKNKSSLNRHHKENHDFENLNKCIYCGKKRIRLNEHQKRCQLKLLLKNNESSSQNKNIGNDKSNEQNEIIIKEEPKLINNSNKNTAQDLQKLLDSLSEDNKQTEEISEYIIYKNIIIGEGGSTRVFYGIDKDKNFEVAIKIEKKKKSLLCESLILDDLNSIENIPNKYSFIISKNNTLLIQNVFGPSLKKLLLYQKDYFDLWTIC